MDKQGSYYDAAEQIIHIDQPEPVGWPNSLSQFYINPNCPEFGHLSRIILHETLHHWQSASFPFWALVIAEHKRNFEKNPLAEFGLDLPSELFLDSQEGFSAWHLYECWSRFWDTHMRGANNVMRDEMHDDVDLKIDGAQGHNIGKKSYTGDAFDYVVASGRMGQQYEAPYTWMMEQTAEAIHPPELRHLGSVFKSEDPEASYISFFLQRRLPANRFYILSNSKPRIRL